MCVRELPTTEELSDYLKNNGAQNVTVINLKDPLVNITHFVIASASSTRLIRQLAETISENVSVLDNQYGHVMVFIRLFCVH